ncbi:hypothetical protein [Streptomyces sp. NPDC051567]|uniref:hypothetical protein n=1 Tax=Streptomyces sp. NPDC051567 TaxID=3365660 RepID=UPI00379B4F9C
MSAAADAQQAGHRVEEVLDRLAATGDREVCAAAEELVRVLMDFYGAGLARIVEHLGGPADAPRPGSRTALPPALPPALLDDELVASLLTLHHLHPEDVGTRIDRALTSAGNALEPLGFDEATGTLRLRPAPGAGGCGCSSATEVPAATRDLLACYAPEVTTVELAPAGPPPLPLLQIGTRPHTPARVP